MLFILAGKEKLAALPSKTDVIRSLIGGTLSIFVLLQLGTLTGNLWIMAPFGASCVLLYAVAQSPLAQPRNIILGHCIAALIGLVFLKLFSVTMFSIALSVGCAIALMQIFNCVHPPAGANPLVILLSANTFHYDWHFLLFPVLSGAIVLVLIALIINNIHRLQKLTQSSLGFNQTKNHTARTKDKA